MLLYLAGYSEAFEFSGTDATVVNPDGTAHQLWFEIAASKKQRALGLMFRQQLADDRGMIFIFPEPQIARMWMKDTLLRLDMLFVDDRGIVQEVKANRAPFSETLISSREKVRYVVELKGGVSAANGITSGTKIELPNAVAALR